MKDTKPDYDQSMKEHSQYIWNARNGRILHDTDGAGDKIIDDDNDQPFA
jgi:hypothetical protein